MSLNLFGFLRPKLLRILTVNIFRATMQNQHKAWQLIRTDCKVGDLGLLLSPDGSLDLRALSSSEHKGLDKGIPFARHPCSETLQVPCRGMGNRSPELNLHVTCQHMTSV